MSKNFNTTNDSFRKIIGNGLTYVVPKFQRDYSWEAEQWEDLWQDIVEQSREKNSDDQSHYMGYLVLQAINDKEFKIIDGQQRITTLMIIILAALDKITKLIENSSDERLKTDNKTRLETLKSTYIGFTDPVSLRTKPKLQLNKNNKDYFRSLCSLTDRLKERGVKRSERLLFQAKAFFVKKMEDEDNDFLKDGEGIARFVDKMSDILFFTVITVSSDLNAYKVFETLNARGVKLSTPDLVKNHLFSMVDDRGQITETEIEDLECKWEDITQSLGKSDFSKFIQTHWNSKNKATRHNQLFRSIKSSILGKDQLFRYLAELEEASEIFAALDSERNYQEEFWNDADFKTIKDPLKTLRFFSITQPYSLLIAAYKNFGRAEFCKVFGYIDVISIRYNVVGQRQANNQERIYNQIALDISSGSIKNLSGVKDRLKDIYPSDEEFKSDFLRKEFRTSQSDKKVRYILERLEKSINPSFLADDSEATLEHVLPQSFESSPWSRGDYEEGDVGNIGNMTLLDKKTNKDIGTKSFIEKKASYSSSSYLITKNIAQDYDEWSHDSIQRRQKKLADQAAKCWKIEFDPITK